MGYASTVINYNDLMCVYANLGQYKKVDVQAEMKENGVSPDNFSYRTCIISYGMRADINGMESQNHIKMDWKTISLVAKYYLKAGLTDKATVALKRLEEKLYKKQFLGYNYVISHIGNKTELLRFWDIQKAASIVGGHMDYMAMVDALVMFGELEEAESLVEEWELFIQCNDYRVRSAFLNEFFENILFEEAEALILKMSKIGMHRLQNNWARNSGVRIIGYI